MRQNHEQCVPEYSNSPTPLVLNDIRIILTLVALDAVNDLLALILAHRVIICAGCLASTLTTAKGPLTLHELEVPSLRIPWMRRNVIVNCEKIMTFSVPSFRCSMSSTSSINLRIFVEPLSKVPTLLATTAWQELQCVSFGLSSLGVMSAIFRTLPTSLTRRSRAGSSMRHQDSTCRGP